MGESIQRKKLIELREASAALEKLAGSIAALAMQGHSPDTLIGELTQRGQQVQKLRGELIEHIAARLAQDPAESEKLSLDELDIKVRECELRDSMDREAVSALREAVNLLTRLKAPACDAPDGSELTRQAESALASGDSAQVSEIARQGQPYYDLAALVRGDREAMRRDTELVARLAKYYPQIAWFVRARTQLESGAEPSFDELRDESIDSLRTAVTDEETMAPTGEAVAPEASVPERRPEPGLILTRKECDSLIYEGSANSGPTERAIRRYMRAALLTGDRSAGLNALPPLTCLDVFAAACEKGREALSGAVRTCIVQARQFDGILADTIQYLKTVGTSRPNSPMGARVWDDLLGESGAISALLIAIVNGSREEYPSVRKMYNLLSGGSSSGSLSMDNLDKLISGIWTREAQAAGMNMGLPPRAYLMEWLNILSPAFLILGKWCSVIREEESV